MNQPTTKPKIFIWCEQYKGVTGDNWCGNATAEDGKQLAEHWSSSRVWVRFDMGLTSRKKHEVYEAYYPNGFEFVDLVDLSSEDLDDHKELMAAIERGIEQDSPYSNND